MPFQPECLSEQHKENIVTPPCLRAAMEGGENLAWPADKNVGFPSEYPTTSHWIKSFRSRLDYLRSTEELPATCDLLIIGSGITGTSIAYYLTKEQPNLRIAMVEARSFCSGATGRNGGHCFRPEGWSMRDAVERYGVTEALAVRRFHIKNRDIMQEVIAEHGVSEIIDCNFSGGVQIFHSQQERDDHIQDLKLCEELGFEHESVVVSAEEMSKILEVRNEFGGLYTQKSGSFWPRKFVAAMMEVAMARGDINLQTNTCVTSIEETSDPAFRWQAKTERGSILVGTVVHATNAYAGALLPELMGTKLEIIPTPDMVLAARPSPTQDSLGTWPVNVLSNYGYHWLVQMPKEPQSTQENVVVYGLYSGSPSTNDEILLEDSNEKLNDYRRYLAYTFPKKFSCTDDQGRIPLDSIESVWTGIIGNTHDDSAIVGPVKGKNGQFLACGFNGQGMVRCWGSGLVLADMLLWEMKERDLSLWSPAKWYPRHWIKNLD